LLFFQFLPPESLPFDVKNEDKLTDPDFEDENRNISQPEDLTITGILSATTYKCCPHTGKLSSYNIFL
jgi:hypothetical protein